MAMHARVCVCVLYAVADTNCLRMNVLLSSCLSCLLLRLPASADKAIVLHVSVAPLVLSLLLAAGEDANVGLVLDSVPQLSAAVEPLRSAAEGATMRSTVSGLQ